MRTFVTGIISGLLISWPLICRMLIKHADTANTTLVIACLLSWLFGFIAAVVGLLIPKESSNDFYFLGKIMCGCLSAIWLLCTLLLMASCSKALSEIH